MSMDILRVESNERVDIADFEFISESVQAHERQMIDNFMCDPARARKWVLSGFAMTNPAAKQLQVDKGKAILGSRIGGSVKYGVLTTEGDASLTVDLNSYSAGTYGIYVRFERIEGESQSRIFWNPSGAGSEYAQATNTRWTAAWALRVEATNPGDEWLKIGDVDQATMAITDMREFYFEGAVDASYESGWSSDGGGAANDRNADRATYGCTDLQMMLAALRQSITDIRGRGLREWYDQGVGGLNVGFDTDPEEDSLKIGDVNFEIALSAGNPVINFDTNDYIAFNRATNQMGFTASGSTFVFQSGALFPAIDDSVNLGDGTHYFGIGYITALYLGTAASEGVAVDLLPASGALDLGGTGREWVDLHLSGNAVVGEDVFVAGGINVGGAVNPAAGEGIFSKGISVGVDAAPAADSIYLGATTASLAYSSATQSMTITGNTDNYIAILGIADSIDFYVGGADALLLTPGILKSQTAGALDLGDSTDYWGELFAECGKFLTADPGGTAGFLTLSGYTDGGGGAGGTIAGAAGNPSSGWFKWYIGTSAVYVPYWNSIT